MAASTSYLGSGRRSEVKFIIPICIQQENFEDAYNKIGTGWRLS
jgi:hypothetical protein